MSIDAERSLLGGLLIWPDEFPGVAKLVSPEDFSSPDHARIFGAMSELHRAGVLTECETLLDLDTLGLEVPSAARLSFYAEGILDAAQRRRVIEAARAVAQLGADWHGTSSELWLEADRRMRAAAGRERTVNG